MLLKHAGRRIKAESVEQAGARFDRIQEKAKRTDAAGQRRQHLRIQVDAGRHLAGLLGKVRSGSGRVIVTEQFHHSGNLTEVRLCGVQGLATLIGFTEIIVENRFSFTQPGLRFGGKRRNRQPFLHRGSQTPQPQRGFLIDRAAMQGGIDTPGQLTGAPRQIFEVLESERHQLFDEQQRGCYLNAYRLGDRTGVLAELFDYTNPGLDQIVQSVNTQFVSCVPEMRKPLFELAEMLADATRL